MDPAHRKIFIHDLSWDATAETLTSMFGKYGEIEDCKVVADKVSGKSKGYTFILFKHRDDARKALKNSQKDLGLFLDLGLASAGPVPTPHPNTNPVFEYTQRKIFMWDLGLFLGLHSIIRLNSRGVFGMVVSSKYMASVQPYLRQKEGVFASVNTRGQKLPLLASPQYASVLEPG